MEKVYGVNEGAGSSAIVAAGKGMEDEGGFEVEIGSTGMGR